jgi:hypothetical protein
MVYDVMKHISLISVILSSSLIWLDIETLKKRNIYGYPTMYSFPWMRTNDGQSHTYIGIKRSHGEKYVVGRLVDLTNNVCDYDRDRAINWLKDSGVNISESIKGDKAKQFLAENELFRGPPIIMRPINWKN